MNNHVAPPFDQISRFRRVQLNLSGRYYFQREGEFPCHIYEISPGDAALLAPVKPPPGMRVILYLSALGRFAGVATRQTKAGFEMTLDMSAAKRDRLADQLTWYANRLADAAVCERRRSERIVPLKPVTLIKLPWGVERLARIRSVSLSGVGIECDFWPALNSTVFIGKREAIVVRHFDDGFACEFVKHFAPDELDETIRL